MSLKTDELESRTKTGIKKALTVKLVEFCGKDVRPMEIISGGGFKSLAQFLISVGAEHGNIDISTILPHPTTVSRHIVDVKKSVNDKIFPIICNAMINSECSATTDMWTDDFKKRSFLTMTVHFFDDNLILKKHVLFNSFFGEPEEVKKILEKSGKNIKAEIIKQFESLGYDAELLKKVKFVTDLGSNIVLALEDYSRDDCRTHRLNTILQNTFESEDVPLSIVKIIKICKKIVRYLKQSGKTNQLAKAVVQECETRWNTKLGMIQSIIEQYDRIIELLSIEQRRNWFINVDLAKEIVTFLIPFEEATKSLEGSSYVTASKILLWWDNLSNHLNEENFIEPSVKALVPIAKNYFNLKFKMTMDNKIACFLDPRYRFLKMLPENERSEVYTEIKKLLEELDPTIESEDLPPPCKKRRFLIFEGSSSDVENLGEFEDYMQNANYSEYLRTPENKKHLVESFWGNNKKRFPRLYRLARKRLHVPASSAPSETVFSCAGRTYGKTRTNLKPQTLDDLIFLNSNLELVWYVIKF